MEQTARQCLLLAVLLCMVIVMLYLLDKKIHQFETTNAKLTTKLPALAKDTQQSSSSSGALRKRELDNPSQKSRNAYVTLISGINKSFSYRGFLYNTLIMHQALQSLGSTADFIALIGYSEDDHSPYIDDMNLLKSRGIIVYELPRFLRPTCPLSFAEMALLKVTPFKFTQYERVQFFDGDVMPTKNMDCFFELNVNTYTVGAVSPLNSGWYLAIPDVDTYHYFKEKALWRLGRDWDSINGWGVKMPDGMTFRGGEKCEKWEFNGADMDQGLFAHYFMVTKGNGLIIDAELRQANLFEKPIVVESPNTLPLKTALKCCGGEVPTKFFAHFTGRSKPWMQDLTNLVSNKRNADVRTWIQHLDNLNMPINSKNIADMKLGSPLGFFNANFPKGGYKAGYKAECFE